MPVFFLFMLLFFLLACNNTQKQESPTWSERFEIDSISAIADIQLIENPIEQEAIVMEIVENHPELLKCVLTSRLAKQDVSGTSNAYICYR